jgi:uncharacterized membrane protein YphA (DoxX/SURF4 family)
LLLRGAVGIWMVLQGGAHILGGAAVWWIILAGVLPVTIGLALLIGFLTPIAGAAVVLLSVGRALSLMPAPAPRLLDNPAGAWFMLAIAAGIVLIGPGAFSLDSYLFGRREINIPPSRPGDTFV